MSDRMFGVPFVVCGGLALLVALVFTVVIPNKAAVLDATGLRFLSCAGSTR